MSKLNNEIKLAFGCLAVAVMSPVVIVVFGVLPTYGLVGKEVSKLHIDNVLQRSHLLIGILSPIAVLALLGFIALLVLGLLKVGKTDGS
jgi:ABC-type enterochelin transport system permease subunit